ncbi:MAG: MarC family protein, partial [bacterium]
MTLFSAALTLFLVMDSLGNIPLFISVLRNVDDRRRRLV